ncbi:hypothetical protein K3495_g862 [Podosphaera aphanis]|nr:hypothetical protein K3495_g862 [Podosphaera aphanis]
MHPGSTINQSRFHQIAIKLPSEHNTSTSFLIPTEGADFPQNTKK